MTHPGTNKLPTARFNRYKSLLVVIMLLGFALRLYRLGADSLWYDETVSAFLAAETVPELIGHTTRDIHPPGYYLLLHFWTLAAGQTEFALTFFSVISGLLLIPLTYRLARYLTGQSIAIWAALLVTISPYHIWYAQEVRMYTLGALLGLWAAYCGLRALAAPKVFRYWSGYLFAAALGLYTLYYFAFLLLVINCFFVLYILRPRLNGSALRSLVMVNSLVLLIYLPWLPIVWRQATEPPVPPWRTSASLSLWSTLLESWSVLAFGQSLEPAPFWPILLLSLALFILGLLYLTFQPSTFFFAYTFGPLLLIYLLSFVTPLYHVRYLFIYSPPFYIILAAGLAWLMARRWLWVSVVTASLLLATCFFSLYQYHVDPRYRADDYRAAVHFIQSHWQPGDVIMVNAGYVYPAFLYYTHLPNLQRQRLVPYARPVSIGQPLLWQTGSINGASHLGWGDPRSDFYAMSAADTLAALEAISHDAARLWLLRAYDTVTDPAGLIRTWLAEHTIPLEDEPFAGESNIRAQGFLLSGANALPSAGQTVQFDDGMALVGWSLPEQAWQAGQTIPVRLWWRADHSPRVDYKMSLKLWTATAKLAAQGQDTWPVGTLYRATVWPPGQMVYQAAEIALPGDLAPGQYWLNVELYHPETALPLPRLDEADPVVTLGPVLLE
jgi:mannosyltransferase